MIVKPVELTKPEHLPEENWKALAAEQERFNAAFEREDLSDVVGQMKAMVECIARITYELSGEPASVNSKFEGLVGGAHERLKRQPGSDLSTQPAVGEMADGAKKLAVKLAALRNDIGTGHGRAQLPELHEDAVAIAVDAGMLWSRWALSRLNSYAYGRPTKLMRDLVCGVTFYSGTLTERLTSANIEALEPQQQRVLGLAVGRRAATGTFVVREDGVDAPSTDGTLSPWTADYRKGVASGLLRSISNRWTLDTQTFTGAVGVLSAIPDITDWLAELVKGLHDDAPALADTHWQGKLSDAVDKVARTRPAHEKECWEYIKSFITPDS